MSTIGLINIIAKANSNSVVKETEKAKKSISDLKSEAASSGSSFGKFNSGLSGVQGAITGVVAAIGAGALVASFKAFVQESAHSVVETTRLADRLGVTSEAIIGLQHAASQSLGADQVEAFTDALSDMQEKIGDITLEEGGAKDIVKILGLDAAKLAGQDAVTNFKQIADAISKVKSKAEKLHIADTLFGGQGQKLLPLLEQGSAGIEQFAREAENLGLTFSRVDAAKVEAANAAMGRLGAVFKGIGQQLAIGLAPYIEATANALTNLGAQGIDVAGYVESGMGLISGSLGIVADTVDTVGLAWEGLEAITASVISGIVSGVASIGDPLNNLIKITTDWDLSWKAVEATGISVAAVYLNVISTIGNGLETVINYVPGVKEAVAGLGIGWTAMGGAAAQAFATALTTLADVGEGIEWLLNQIPGINVTFGTALKDMAKQAQDFADQSFAEVNDALNKPIDTTGVDDFFDGLRDTASNTADLAESRWQDFNRSLEYTPDNAGVKSFFDGIKTSAEGVGQYADEMWAQFNTSLMAAPPSEYINGFFDSIQTGATKAAEAIAAAKQPIDELGKSLLGVGLKVGELTDKLTEQIATYGKSSTEVEIYKLKALGATDEQLDAVKKLSNELKAKNIIENNLTPLEKYRKEVAELQEVLNSGAIDQTTFNRAKSKAAKDSGLNEVKFASATEFGSNEARQAVLRHQGIGSKDPTLGVEKNTATLVSEAKKQSGYMAKIAKTIGQDETFSFN